MRLLFAHERFGAFGGAEANILVTAAEFKKRGHRVGILHGPATGKGEATWRQVFGADDDFELGPDRPDEALASIRAEFQPDAIYVHKLADLDWLEALVESGVPVIRMVHDHDLYCMRSYKYNYFTRQMCARPASAYCVFPCGAFLARDEESRLRVKWVSYPAKMK
jgi:hypothetical protein